MITPADRFWPKVAKAEDPDGCWLWTAAQDGNGYGAFWAGTYTEGGHPRVVKAYRWAWEDEHGPVPEGLELDHLCRVTLCVRPSHLEAVTHAENVARGRLGQPREVCPQGHLYAEHGFVDSAGARRCRPCHRDTSREASRRFRAKVVA